MTIHTKASCQKQCKVKFRWCCWSRNLEQRRILYHWQQEGKTYSVDQDIGIKDFWGGRDHYRVEYTIPVYVEHQWEAYEYIYLCTVSGNLEQNMRNVPTMIHKNKWHIMGKLDFYLKKSWKVTLNSELIHDVAIQA